MRFDTTPQAAAIQERIFRQMSTSQRFKLALEMSESVRKVALAGLHSRRPELNAEEQSRELLRIMCGFAPPAVTLEALLPHLVTALERAEVPYMLTGSVASSAHGIPRSTRS